MILLWQKPTKPAHERKGTIWFAELLKEDNGNYYIKITTYIKGTNINIVVSNKGRVYQRFSWNNEVRKANIYLSMNGKTHMSFEEFEQMIQAVEIAKETLEEIDN